MTFVREVEELKVKRADGTLVEYALDQHGMPHARCAEHNAEFFIVQSQ